MTTLSSFLKYNKKPELWSIGIYTFSNFFNKGTSFLLLFYFTHVLAEKDFGLLSLFSNSILFLMPFVSMGILQSANTDFFRLEKREFKNFFTTTLAMPVIVTLIAIIVLIFFKPQLQHRYSFPTFFILIFPIITFFTFLNEHLINMVRNNNDPIKYFIINLGRLLIEIGFAVFFISGLHYGWIGRVMGIFVSLTVIAIYSYIYFKQKKLIFGRFTKKYIYEELLYSIPIIVMQFSVFCMGSSSGYFIEFFTHNYAEVGIFSVAATFGSIITVFCTALLQYVYPKIYSLLSENEINYASIRKLFLFFSGMMLLGTVAVIIATPLAYVLVLKQSYLPGLKYYYFICIGNFFWSISYFLYSFLLFNKQKRKILFSSILSIAVSITANYFFIKTNGSYGAAGSVCIIYFIVLMITIFFVYKQIVPIFGHKETLKLTINNDL